MAQQCKLLALSRSIVYYRPVDVCHEDLRLMKAIDEIHLAQPFRGSHRIRDELVDRGVVAHINRKKVQRLMRQMGLVALYPKKKTSLPDKGHKIYPYLLKDLTIDRPNQVWATEYLLYSDDQRFSPSNRTGYLSRPAAFIQYWQTF